MLWFALPVAQAMTTPANSLADLSLEELANIEITSVSRRPERLNDAAASVYVITSEDIRRSGATTLAEALRLAPNLQVAQLDAGQYAISARGFNNAIGNKLLVLIDGRTVYAPFYSGVQWDQQDVMLEDVERIEVISGPGGTLWGTNAVNGVINVVTLPTSQTQGALAVANAGKLESGASLRYGGSLESSGRFRVYAKALQLQNSRTAGGASLPDGWDRAQAGFRADWGGAGNGFMLQGGAFHAKSEDRGFFGPFALGAVQVSEANLLGQWTRRLASGADIRVQGYYDHSERDDGVLYKPQEDTLDVEFQHGVPLGPHRVLWGAGYRRSHNDIQPGVFFGFVPATSTQTWTSLFLQGELKVTDSVSATVGSRLERNDFTGTEFLPNARLAWKLSNDQLLWAAASRAIRAPSRLDRDIVLPPNPPYIIAGGPDFVSEVANVYELGYRAQPVRELSLSFTAFHQDWDRLRSGQPPPNAQVQNMIDGSTSGLEAWFLWEPWREWRLSGGGTTLHKNLRLKAGSTDPTGPSELGNDPDHQWMLRSSFTLEERHEFDLTVRRVAALPAPSVPAYTAVDFRYGWRISSALSVALTLRNALDPAHAEFGAAPGRSETARSALLQVRWGL
ncbi:MAG: TonB-dependent receptor [Burkholderiales bacterium]